MFPISAAGAMIALLLFPAQAQQSGRPPTSAAAPPQVIGCASLANLRRVLSDAKDDPGAVLAIIKDPKADLGCAIVDPSAVTGFADHVTLNGHAYDCLALQSTSICHWVVAGSVTPAVPAAAPREAPAASGAPKGRR